jgi:hypothetical protein
MVGFGVHEYRAATREVEMQQAVRLRNGQAEDPAIEILCRLEVVY